MTKDQIISALVEKHQLFSALFDTLSQEQFETSIANKWSPGEQLDHILASVVPLAKGLSLSPKFIIKTSFGLSKNGSKSFDETIKMYEQKLNEGAKSPKKFEPKNILLKDKVRLQEQLRSAVSKLSDALSKYKEKDLDLYRLPHPLLGKLTLREMLYFTIYHVDHHLAKTKENL